MPRGIFTPPVAAVGRAHTIACLGDGVTGTYAYGVRPDQNYPEQLAQLLRSVGGRVRAHEWHHDGNTTGPYNLITSKITAVASTTSVTVGTGLAIAANDVVWINSQASQVNSYTSGTGVLTLTSAINSAVPGMTIYDVGQTPTDMMTRGTGAGTPFVGTTSNPELTRKGIPTVAILWGGGNDPAHLWRSGAAGSYAAYGGSGTPTGGANATSTVASSTQNQQGTDTLTVHAGDGNKFIAGQALIVGSGASIQSGIVGSITGDVVRFVSPLSGAVGSNAYVGQGTQPNLQFMAQWLLNQGCQYVLICSSQLLNYPGGTGDFSSAGALNAGGGTALFSAEYLPLRALQLAVAQATYTGGTVAYCDVFNAEAAIALGIASNSTGTNPFGATNQVSFNGTTYTVYPGTRESSPSAGGYNWQAMAGNIATSTVGAGGNGYAVGDWLLASGGHGVGATFTVSSVSSGAITGLTPQNPGTGYVVGDVLPLVAGNTNGAGATATVSTVATPNQHLNPLGCWIVANIIFKTIQGYSDLMTILKT